MKTLSEPHDGSQRFAALHVSLIDLTIGRAHLFSPDHFLKTHSVDTPSASNVKAQRVDASDGINTPILPLLYGYLTLFTITSNRSGAYREFNGQNLHIGLYKSHNFTFWSSLSACLGAATVPAFLELGDIKAVLSLAASNQSSASLNDFSASSFPKPTYFTASHPSQPGIAPSTVRYRINAC